MDWRIKASLQKLLTLSRIGDKLNHIPATLNKEYHHNVVKYQFYECIRKFKSIDIDLNQMPLALEIGTGYSIISPLVLSLLGFGKVITVDIDADVNFIAFQKELKYLNRKEFIDQISNLGIYSEDIIKAKLATIKQCKSLDKVLAFANIKYIAPYTIEEIDKEENNFDYISSQVVFEHIPPEFLELLFRKFKVWLKKDCFTVHTINFIDHFANPGIFQDKKISEFNFLRFSDKYWKFWSGNPIAYTNRLSYLYYQELFKINNLHIVNFIGENYRPSKVLETNQIHVDILKKYKSKPNLIELTKYQRGTFIVKN